MSLKQNFNELLKVYNAQEMIQAEVKKRSYYLDRVSMDKTWGGGEIPLPVEAGEASSMGFEGLIASSDISQGSYLKGKIQTPHEFLASMKFDQRDLEVHGDLKKSFLKILPDKVERFVGRISERLNVMLLADGAVCALTADGLSTGWVEVDVPTLLTIGEKLEIKSDEEPALTVYVGEIDKPGKKVRLFDARTAGTACDLTDYKIADAAKLYLPGSVTGGFTSLKKQLLPASLGGSDTWFTLDKADAPVLQAAYHDGSSMNATNFMDKLFEFYLETLFVGEGNATEAVMNMKHLGKIIPKLEGSRRYAVTDKSAGYGFRKITLIGPEGGEFTIVGVRDMPTDLIYMLDWSKHKFYTDKFIERIKNPDGLEYYTERVAGVNGGYSHICDYRVYGELAIIPGGNGVIHSVPA